jgi:DNA-binding winged helix-turn-helix (wHTH) protein
MHSFSPNSVVRFGAFQLDAATGELRENGLLRKLPRQPFKVLALLAGRAGQIVSREEIRRCLWGDRIHVEVDDGINFCMNQIRQALHDPAERSEYIKTIPRQGYCFIASTICAEDPAARAPAVLAAPPPARTAGAGSRRFSLAALACRKSTRIRRSACLRTVDGRHFTVRVPQESVHR